MGRLANKIKSENERGSRASLIEELFYDFNRSRVQIYKMNFVRGIFFGFGSVIGGTVVIAILAWILGFFANVTGTSDSYQKVQDTIKSVTK
jgi:hypothetical protein